MPGTLNVWLNSTRVGDITNIAGDYNIFAFDESYRENQRRPTLSQSLVNQYGQPLQHIPRVHTLSPPFFSNLLPEADSMLRSLLARQHKISVVPDFGFLRTLGDDLPGAVRVLYEGSVPETFDDHEPLQASSSVPLRFSLAGVQLKFSASMNGDRLTIPSKGGSWIVKLPTNMYPRLPENEFAMMRFASAIGLNVPAIHLLDVSAIKNLPEGLPELRSGEPSLAYVIARFDRPPLGQRLHFEDLNQIAGQFPADKYENKTLEYVATVVGELCPLEDVEELVARIVFGIAIANNDMHLKNWAITYPQEGSPRIAPLYDFVCTKLYYPNSELALSIAKEKQYARIDVETFVTFAERSGLSQRAVRRAVNQTVERINATWPSFKGTMADDELIAVLDRHFQELPLLSSRPLDKRHSH